jgi:hypothetical protein
MTAAFRQARRRGETSTVATAGSASRQARRRGETSAVATGGTVDEVLLGSVATWAVVGIVDDPTTGSTLAAMMAR